MRKILTKRERFSGYAKSRIGIELGIHDKNRISLRVGDKVKCGDFEGIILYNPWSKRYEFFYGYSRWYGDNEYDSNSYGKSFNIPMDDGMRTQLELLNK